MVRMTTYPHGAFCWVELSTTDVEGAESFYSQLFGWATEGSPVPGGGVYTMCKKDDAFVGALQTLQDEMRDRGHPPFWMSYVAVDGVDKAAARAEELGAKILAPPFDVMDVGRMAIVQDPAKAAFALWEAKTHPGAGVVREPGALAWNELSTSNVDAARDFYTGLLGWTVETTDMGEGREYTLFSAGGQRVAGMMAIAPDMGPVPASWSVSFQVEDPDASAARAGELGGAVVVPPTDFPGGRFAVVTDPQGAAFGVLSMPASDAG